MKLTTATQQGNSRMRVRNCCSFPSQTFRHGAKPAVVTAIATLIILSIAHHGRADELYIGGASVSITPDGPVSLAGQMVTRIARKVESEVTATALAIESRDGDRALDQAILISCDLVCIRGGILEQTREILKDLLPDFDVNKLVLNATHTHTAPTLIEGRYTLPSSGIMQPAEYVEFFSQRVADAAATAWKSRKRGGVGWGLGHASVAYNRRGVYADGRSVMYGKTAASDFRGLEGYEDNGVEILFFWTAEEKLLATAINVASPAQTVEGRSTVNADFWHPIRESLKAKYGQDLLVLGWTGAAGDQAPRPMFRKQAEERMRKLRGVTQLEELSRRVVVAWEETYAAAKKEIHTDVAFVHNVQTIELPRRKVTEAEFTRTTKQVVALSKDPANIWRKNWKQAVVDRYNRQQADTEQPYRMELHAIRIGEVSIATNDFELFTDFGIQMKARSPALQTFVIQLCGPGTYIPTERAVRGGGYSAIVESSEVGPKGGQVLTDHTIDVLKSLWRDE